MSIFKYGVTYTTDDDAKYDLTHNKKPDCAAAMSKLYEQARLKDFTIDQAHDYAILKHYQQDHPKAEPTEERALANIEDFLALCDHPERINEAIKSYRFYIDTWELDRGNAFRAAIMPTVVERDAEQEKEVLQKLEELPDPMREVVKAIYHGAREAGASIEEAVLYAAAAAAGPRTHTDD